MSEEGDGLDGKEELTPPDWRVRAGPSNKPTQEEREEEERTNRNSRLESANRLQKQTECKRKRRTRSNTRTVQRLVHTLQRLAEGAPITTSPTKERGSVEKTHHCDGLLLHQNEACCECSNDVRRMSDVCIRVKADRHKNTMSRVALKKGSGRTVDN